jgi:hypothetical protein
MFEERFKRKPEQNIGMKTLFRQARDHRAIGRYWQTFILPGKRCATVPFYGA